jgi:transposase
VTALLNWAKISPVRGEQTARSSCRNHSAAFKAKAALEAVRGEQPLAKLVTKLDIHARKIAQWKAELLKGA